VAVTADGAAVLCERTVSLSALQDEMSSIAPRHARDGIVADAVLSSFGDSASARPVCGESDGLWSSLYLASLCLRAAVAPGPDVTAAAWQVFEGLELLNRCDVRVCIDM
jgi:hypothetical protein